MAVENCTRCRSSVRALQTLYTLHSTYWTLLDTSLLHVRLAAQRGELAVALGAARLVARAQAAQLVLELVLSCLRISASTSDMRRSVASRVHSSAWSLRHRGAKRANACMRWMSRWSGGTRARAPMQVQGRRVR